MRVAVYYAPLPDDPLFALSTAWLGRDPANREPVPQPDMQGLMEVTAEPRLYGFHATLKPPMRLRSGHGLGRAGRAPLAELAAGIASFELPPMAVADVHGFLALRETEPSPRLQALADLCVAGLDGFRAPPDADELRGGAVAGCRPRRTRCCVAGGIRMCSAPGSFI